MSWASGWDPRSFSARPRSDMDLARLRDFLARVPRTWRAALEFRHESWFTDEVYDALRAHDVALVAAEEDERGAGAPLVPTASWGYLRLRKRPMLPRS